MTGRFVVSLDFELYWGVRDKRSLVAYRENLLGVREVVPALLKVFDQFALHVTWATVGLLFCTGREDALANLPQVKPNYAVERFSPFVDCSAWGDDEKTDPFHFAPSLIDAIAATPHQEIATHTFSHYYCLEAGQDAAAFEADLAAATALAGRRGIALRSIVFPRNQVNEDYLPICRRAGIKAYRGTLKRDLYNPRSEDEQRPVLRAQRLLDNYLPLTRDRSIAAGDLGVASPYNVAASSFLRPYSRRLAFLDDLRFRRLASELTRAARTNSVYHLWWHPHNFGRDLSANLHFLTRVLNHFSRLRDRYGMQSATMAEIAEQREQRGAMA